MSGQNPVNINAESIAASAEAAAKGRGIPPVEQWNPPFCGNLDMRIARDGTWHHEGSPIRRPAMVRLFSTILRKDGDDFFLVTPVEKVGITVEDAPFIAVDFDSEGEGKEQRLIFTTNVGDTVVAGPDAPIFVVRDGKTGAPSPYVRVRTALDAKIDRKSFYRLLEHATEAPHKGESWFGVWSQEQFFPIAPASELDGEG